MSEKMSTSALEENMHEMLGAAELLTSRALEAADKEEWARALRRAHDAIAAHIAALNAEIFDWKQAAGVEAKERRESHEREAALREALEYVASRTEHLHGLAHVTGTARAALNGSELLRNHLEQGKPEPASDGSKDA